MPVLKPCTRIHIEITAFLFGRRCSILSYRVERKDGSTYGSAVCDVQCWRLCSPSSRQLVFACTILSQHATSVLLPPVSPTKSHISCACTGCPIDHLRPDLLLQTHIVLISRMHSLHDPHPERRGTALADLVCRASTCESQLILQPQRRNADFLGRSATSRRCEGLPPRA